MLDRDLTLVERGPFDGGVGTLSRSGGFSRASVVVRGPPDFPFDMMAHWRRADGSNVPEDPNDRRRVITGPAGVGTLNFIAPSTDASELLIEIAPADSNGPPQSRF